jgi:hypothetical protein
MSFTYQKQKAMKTYILLFCILALGVANAQVRPTIKRAYFAKDADYEPAAPVTPDASNKDKDSAKATSTTPLTPPVNKGFSFGISLGYNYIFDKLHDIHLSPTDNTVKISQASRTSFLLSTTVSAPLIRFAGDHSRKLFKTEDANGQQVGQSYYIPYGLYLVATVNLLNFSEAGNGTIFNKKIDGGLGIGCRFNDDVLIALTYEMLSVRQPRDFLINEFKDKTISVNNEVVTTLDTSNDTFFIDKYLPSLSLKLVYLIRGEKVKED